MHFSPLPLADKNEVSFSSPMPTVPLDKSAMKNGFRRSAASVSSKSLTPTDNGANLSVYNKKLRSSVSTYSSGEDGDEQILQSYVSTDSDDINTSFQPFGYRSPGYGGMDSTTSSLCVVESFAESGNAAEDAPRSYHSTSFSGTRHNVNESPTGRKVRESSAAAASKNRSPSTLSRRRAPSSTTKTVQANRKQGARQQRKLSAQSVSEELLGGGSCHSPKTNSPVRLSFSQRLTKDIELSKELVQGKATATGEPSLYAFEEEKPISLEFSGVRCCPLLRRCVGKATQTRAAGKKQSQNNTVISAEKEEDINLSPFKTWDFTRFLPQENNGSVDARSPIQGTTAATAKNSRKTLCLDLDETLVHTSLVHMADADAVVKVCPTDSDGDNTYDLYVKYRPFLREFLQFSLKFFEVVIFTASKKYYAKAILSRLQSDYNNLFTFRAPDDEESAASKEAHGDNCMILLHRDHCTPTNAGFVKDLFLLGRDLRTCFIIDNNICCGSFQPYNFIHVKDFARKEKEVSPADGNRAPASKRNGNHGMDQAKLRELKGFRSSGNSLSTESTYLWEDPNDKVLLQLISADEAVLRRDCEEQYTGLLMDLAHSDDVPKYLLNSLIKSKEIADRHPNKN